MFSSSRPFWYYTLGLIIVFWLQSILYWVGPYYMKKSWEHCLRIISNHPQPRFLSLFWKWRLCRVASKLFICKYWEKKLKKKKNTQKSYFELPKPLSSGLKFCLNSSIKAALSLRARVFTIKVILVETYKSLVPWSV